MSGETHIPLSKYIKVLGILLALTVLTVAVATPVSGFDAGFLNAFIAMGVASIKAYFVLAWFMHLRFDDRLYLWIFFISIFFLVVMFAFSWGDIISRVPVESTL